MADTVPTQETTAPVATESTESSTASTASAVDETEALVAAAQAEGELLVYSATPEPVAQPLYDAFTAEYGIKVNTIPRVVTSELIARFEGELSSGGSPADVISIASPTFYQGHVDDGVVTPVADLALPALEGFPEEFVGDGYVDVGAAPIGVCFNSDAVNDMTSYQDLLNPDLRAVWVDPTTNDPALAIWLVVGDDQGPDFISQWAAREKTLTASVVPGAQLVVAGEGDFVFPCYETIAMALGNEGAPITYKVLGPTTGGDSYYGVVANSAHPAAARLFMNYIVSEEGQMALTAGNYASPLGNDFPDAFTLPEDYVTIDLAFAERLNDERESLIAALGV
ncbi:MAG: ABC transporter substrate-binding protein [Ilumatobacteraceae bacterium]